VLLKQRASELGQRLGADIVERPEDAFAILDRERHHLVSRASDFSRKNRVGSSTSLTSSRTSSSGIRRSARYTETMGVTRDCVSDQPERSPLDRASEANVSVGLGGQERMFAHLVARFAIEPAGEMILVSRPLRPLSKSGK
jgi:hypothetical protein